MFEAVFHVYNLNGLGTKYVSKNISSQVRLTDPFLVGPGQKTTEPKQKSETPRLQSEVAMVVYIKNISCYYLREHLHTSSIAHSNLSLSDTP